MPGYSFKTTMTLTNKSTDELVVTIPRGSLLEPESTHLSFQSAVVAKDYIFRLNPKETRSVILEAECWNRHLSPPRSVPGKLTPLKGSINKTTDVWRISSAPAKNTVLRPPSQDNSVFGALVSAAPAFAETFLDKATCLAGVCQSEMAELKNTYAGRRVQKLRALGKEQALERFLSGHALREQLIKTGGPTAKNIKIVGDLVTAMYSVSPDKLRGQMYRTALKMRELVEDSEITIDDSCKTQLMDLAQKKFLTIVDALPLCDERRKGVAA